MGHAIHLYCDINGINRFEKHGKDTPYDKTLQRAFDDLGVEEWTGRRALTKYDTLRPDPEELLFALKGKRFAEAKRDMERKQYTRAHLEERIASGQASAKQNKRKTPALRIPPFAGFLHEKMVQEDLLQYMNARFPKKGYKILLQRIAEEETNTVEIIQEPAIAHSCMIEKKEEKQDASDTQNRHPKP